MRRTWMFSPIFAMSAWRASSTVLPLDVFADFSDSTSVAPLASAIFAISFAKPTKLSSLATKSVSLLTSTSTALPPSCASTMRPSAATRLPFLSALARPCLRSHSIATSMSPLFCVSAFLHSIMPAPERSRSSLTRPAVISMVFLDECGARGAASCDSVYRYGAPHKGRPHLPPPAPFPASGRRKGGGGTRGSMPPVRYRPVLLGRRGRFGVGRRFLCAFRTRTARRRRATARGRTLGRLLARRRPAAIVALAVIGGVLRDRVALRVELDELVLLARSHLRRRGLAFEHCVGGGTDI